MPAGKHRTVSGPITEVMVAQTAVIASCAQAAPLELPPRSAGARIIATQLFRQFHIAHAPRGAQF